MKKDLFRKPEMVVEAAQAQKGLVWILEILIFVAVFFVSNICMAIVATPLSLILMFTNGRFMSAAMANDVKAMMLIEEEIASSNVYMLGMLIAEIVMIVIVCLFCKLLQKRKMRTMGFCKKAAVKEYLIGMLAGFACFSLAVLFSVLIGGLKLEISLAFRVAPVRIIGIFLLFLIGFMIQGMAEEVICRGYFMISYARRYPVYAAILANALIFAALHLLNSGISVLAFINLFLFGVFASVYFIRRGNIWGIAAFHSVWNLVQGNFYGIKVSGMDLSDSILTAAPVEGKALFNGGAFGLEGSLPVTVVLIAGILLLYFWKRTEQMAEI
ncbi:MAG: CPBP family intramembrane metalloprotease [Lachnospiraceae bacterium]|nr:CPBP family intramembrane metalloprotease [Lachnospiraceae bacterium]